jgi:hypothetical protein
MAVFLSPVGGAAAQFFTNSGVILWRQAVHLRSGDNHAKSKLYVF